MNFPFFWLLVHELRKFFQTARFWFVLLFSVVPAVIFIDMITEAANDYRDFSSLLTFKNTILGAFLLYLFFYDVLVSIIITSDAFSGERAYSLLFLHSRKAWVYLAKTCSGALILAIANLMASVGLVVVSLSWNVPLSAIDIVLLLLIALLISLTPYSFAVANHCACLRFKNIPQSMANYAVVLWFFVIPFVVYYISLQLYVFNMDFLGFTMLPAVQEVVNYLYGAYKPSIGSVQQHIAYISLCYPAIFLVSGAFFFHLTDR